MATHYGPRGCASGSISSPFGSPVQARAMGAVSGNLYYFKIGLMSSAELYLHLHISHSERSRMT